MNNGIVERRCHWCVSVGVDDAAGSEKHWHCGCDKSAKRSRKTSPHPEHFYGAGASTVRAMMAKYGHSNGFGIKGNSVHPPRRSKAFAR